MIELKKEEVEAIISDLGNLPMKQVENMVGFFRHKIQEAEKAKAEKDVDKSK